MDVFLSDEEFDKLIDNIVSGDDDKYDEDEIEFIDEVLKGDI
jgi:hypothetical protein